MMDDSVDIYGNDYGYSQPEQHQSMVNSENIASIWVNVP